MADHSAEYMKFKVVNGNGQIREDSHRDFRVLTLDKIFDWIDKRGYDAAVNAELKKMVSKYPHNAFASFGKNFEKHLAEAQKLASKNRPMFVGELGDDNYKRVESIGEDLVAPTGRGKIKPLPKAEAFPNDFDDMEMPDPKPEPKKDSAPKDDIPYGIKGIDF